MADYAVSTAFLAIDRVSAAFPKMAKRADMFGDRTSRAFNKASRPASRFGDILKGILGANLIRSGFSLIQRGLGAVGEQFVTVDDALVSAGAKFKDVNLLTAEGRQRLDELRAAARQTGATVEFTATQAAEGLDFLALAGFDSAMAMASLSKTVDLATIGQVDLARSTDIASDALGAFGLMTDDAIQLEKNFARQNDVMALTMSRTNTGLEDMFESIKKGAPIFTLSGQSIESFNALVGIMASDGVKGSESGTQLRNVMLSLADATPKAQKQLKKLGVTVADSSGNFRDIIDIFADIESGLDGLGTQERAQVLAQIFGKRAITGAGILLKKGSVALRAFRQDLIDSGGSAETMATIMRSSLGNQLKALQSAALEVGFKIFDAFATEGRTGIIVFTDAIRNVNLTPVITILKELAAIFGVLIDVAKPFFMIILPIALFTLRALTNLFSQLGPNLTRVIQALLTYVLVMKAIAVVQAIVAATNPFALALIGATLLAAGIMWVIDNWDWLVEQLMIGAKAIGEFFTDVWDGIKKAFMSFVGIIAKGIAVVGSFIGIDTSALDEFASDAIFDTIAPNKTEVENNQTATFSGRLDIAGAPPGSSIESDTTGNANVDIGLAGINP